MAYLVADKLTFGCRHLPYHHNVHSQQHRRNHFQHPYCPALQQKMVATYKIDLNEYKQLQKQMNDNGLILQWNTNASSKHRKFTAVSQLLMLNDAHQQIINEQNTMCSTSAYHKSMQPSSLNSL